VPYFFDSSAIVKYYDPTEIGHEWVKFIVDTYGPVAISNLTIPEVVRALRKKRNNVLNQPGLTASDRNAIRTDYNELIDRWLEDTKTLCTPCFGKVRITSLAVMLLRKYDGHPSASLTDASDALILSTALNWATSVPDPVYFVSADEKTGLVGAARHVLKRWTVLNPNQLPSSELDRVTSGL